MSKRWAPVVARLPFDDCCKFLVITYFKWTLLIRINLIEQKCVNKFRHSHLTFNAISTHPKIPCSSFKSMGKFRGYDISTFSIIVLSFFQICLAKFSISAYWGSAPHKTHTLMFCLRATQTNLYAMFGFFFGKYTGTSGNGLFDDWITVISSFRSTTSRSHQPSVPTNILWCSNTVQNGDPICSLNSFSRRSIWLFSFVKMQSLNFKKSVSADSNSLSKMGKYGWNKENLECKNLHLITGHL